VTPRIAASAWSTPRLRRGGSYFLTSHRWARREQVEAAYPQFAELLLYHVVQAAAVWLLYRGVRSWAESV
jgi:hypothetical protein